MHQTATHQPTRSIQRCREKLHYCCQSSFLLFTTPQTAPDHHQSARSESFPKTSIVAAQQLRPTCCAAPQDFTTPQTSDRAKQIVPKNFHRYGPTPANMLRRATRGAGRVAARGDEVAGQARSPSKPLHKTRPKRLKTLAEGKTGRGRRVLVRGQVSK